METNAMTLKEFIDQYDKIDSVILLEGKRTVLENDQEKLIKLGKILAENSKYMLFRSGNAKGADFYFSQGVISVDKTRLQVITPYSGHRKENNQSHETISLDTINLAAEPELIYQTKQNKKIEKLVDQFVSGNKNKYSIKAAYLLRDTLKVIGTGEIRPATFGIFYDDLVKPKTGGTGHTMNVCEHNGIPIIDQKMWFSWL
jgi:hypothetical protein